MREQGLLGQSAGSQDTETIGWRAEGVARQPRQRQRPSEHTT
jgi:hypothetical protein